VLRVRWRVHNLTSLNYLGADAVDFKGLLTLDHVNELVTFLMLVQREPGRSVGSKSVRDEGNVAAEIA
jgi:hypothetical protein